MQENQLELEEILIVIQIQLLPVGTISKINHNLSAFLVSQS